LQWALLPAVSTAASALRATAAARAAAHEAPCSARIWAVTEEIAACCKKQRCRERSEAES